jgi:hypothetical protein
MEKNRAGSIKYDGGVHDWTGKVLIVNRQCRFEDILP